MFNFIKKIEHHLRKCSTFVCFFHSFPLIWKAPICKRIFRLHFSEIIRWGFMLLSFDKRRKQTLDAKRDFKLFLRKRSWFDRNDMSNIIWGSRHKNRKIRRNRKAEKDHTLGKYELCTFDDKKKRKEKYNNWNQIGKLSHNLI